MSDLKTPMELVSDLSDLLFTIGRNTDDPELKKACLYMVDSPLKFVGETIKSFGGRL